MLPYVARDIAKSIRDALESLPVVVLTGMRQTGKTTLLRTDEAFADRAYFTLDDFTTRETAKRRPESLLNAAPAITIDEAQRCPELLLAIKAAVDRDRRPGRFLLSGSANFRLLKGVAESLAGRAIYLELDPLTRREIMGATRSAPNLAAWLDGADPARTRAPKPVTDDEVLRGGLPTPALRQAKDAELWFRGFEQTYIERDILLLGRIEDPLAFRNLLQLAMLRTGNVLNVSALARDAKLTTITANRYLGLLEASFTIRLLAPDLASRSSRLVKSPKIYSTDSGLAASLAGATDLETSESMRGALYETFVAQNLAAILRVHRPRAELGFWNIQSRHEVDFVARLKRRVIGIEIKSATRFDERDLRSLRAFVEFAKSKRAADPIGILGYQGDEVAEIGDGIFVVPLAVLLA